MLSAISALVASCGLPGIGNDSNADNVSSSIPLITAGQLLDQFDSDGDSASEYYKDKYIKVTGRSQTTTKMFWGTPVLLIQDPERGSLSLRTVVCEFSKDKSSEISSLVMGNDIVMQEVTADHS